MNTKQALLTFLLTAVTLTGCSNPKGAVITKDNQEKVLGDVGPKLSEDERRELVAAYARSAFGSYTLEGKSIDQILTEQKRFEDNEKAREAAVHEAQVREAQRRAAIVARISQAIDVYPVSKDFSPSNYNIENGDVHGDQIVIVFKIRNKTDKAIKKFKGLTHFSNSFGDEIVSNNFDYTHGVPPHATVTYTGVLDYNEFMDRDQKLRSTPLTDMKFKFEPEGITFSDGSQIIAPAAVSSGSI